MKFSGKLRVHSCIAGVQKTYAGHSDSPQRRNGPILSRAESLQDALPGMNDEVGDASLISYNANKVAQLLIRVMTVHTCRHQHTKFLTDCNQNEEHLLWESAVSKISWKMESCDAEATGWTDWLTFQWEMHINQKWNVLWGAYQFCTWQSWGYS